MMVTTHAAAALLLLGAPAAVVAPQFTAAAVGGALLGGVAPDVDLFVGTHRKSLHYPVYASLAGVVAAVVAVAAPSSATVALATFLLAAGLHAASDWFGGSDELRPWERTSPRAVYLHPRKRWLSPRHVVRYDGAPEDFFLTAALALPAAYLVPSARLVVAVGLVVAAVYTLFRRRVPDVLGI
ncbi:metal-dependent hydrolase [Halogeometricum sp. CBA1124]|uniref:metal-dependent hydrolase n=1 Tax=Halogeometricum sp. CBA1124 TaxID=2668071 RepID=UPI00142C8047|nr:metal-dependent hydrolase [Halogeometricum sp. CBA1124]MUV56364.1 metal-dependent hydrolase [Halogeometricum sp. CBA1124]